jgi:hypothetical protein
MPAVKTANWPIILRNFKLTIDSMIRVRNNTKILFQLRSATIVEVMKKFAANPISEVYNFGNKIRRADVAGS